MLAAGGVRVKLSDNTILVAGGPSGIGRALAEQLYLRGNRVIILFAKRNEGTG